MKIAGVDDGYFPLSYKGGKGRTILLSSIFEGSKLIDIDFQLITVDGTDGPPAYEALSKGDINILDGVIVGGFNYIEPGPNDIVFYSYRPNIEKIKNALEKHFPDKRAKYILYVLSNLKEMPTKRGTVYVFSYLPDHVVKEVIEKYQVYSKVPYPLYVSSQIAKKLSKFLFTNFNFL